MLGPLAEDAISPVVVDAEVAERLDEVVALLELVDNREHKCL
jgi:hypothetical protein